MVYIPNGSITGGTLTTLAGGTIESSNTTTLSGVTISRNSVYTASNNATTVLNGIITNDGLIQLFGGNGANGYLAPNSNTTLTGAGTVTLSQINSGGGCACSGWSGGLVSRLALFGEICVSPSWKARRGGIHQQADVRTQWEKGD